MLADREEIVVSCSEDWLVLDDRVPIRLEEGDRLCTCGIAFHSDRAVIRNRCGRKAGGIVEKRHDRRRIEEQPESAANYKAAASLGLVGKSHAGAEGFPIARVEVANLLANHDETSLGRNKRREVFLAIVYGSLVFIAQTEVQVQVPRNLPGILREKVEAVHQHFPFLVAAHDGRLVDETG